MSPRPTQQDTETPRRIEAEGGRLEPHLKTTAAAPLDAVPAEVVRLDKDDLRSGDVTYLEAR